MLKKISLIFVYMLFVFFVHGEYFKSQSYYENRKNRPDFVKAELLYEQALSYIRQAETYSDMGNVRLTDQAMRCVNSLKMAAGGYKTGDKSKINMGTRNFKRHSREYEAAKKQWSNIRKAPCFNPLFHDYDEKKYYDKTIRRNKKRQFITPKVEGQKVEGKHRRKKYKHHGYTVHKDRSRGNTQRAQYLLKRAEFFEKKADYYKNQGKDNIAQNYRKFAIRLRRRIGLAEKANDY